MAKHPRSSRTHGDQHESEDAFIATVERGLAWGREHSRPLTIAGIVVVVLAALGIYYVTSQRRIEAQAQAQFAQVQESLASGNRQLAIRDLRSYLSRFGGTEAAAPARLALADLLLADNQAQEAIDALGDLPQDLDGPYGVAAARILAGVYEALGRIDDAVALDRRIAENARFQFQKREALADAARIRLQNGDPEAAARLYSDVVNLFDEGDPGRGYYSMWLAEARARAEEGAAVPSSSATDSAAGQAGGAAGQPAGDTTTGS